MRARDLGIRIGRMEPGPLNAITDIAGVRVGHTTLVSGDCPAHRLNGNGEATDEAITNALLGAETMTGHDGITAHALDPDRLVADMRAQGRLL